ncbi:hypothetical protein F751_1667 [Auxenochlorella protothecoides]|uniref:Uncharacterized protein n=1 Tax=Auxenochlorella protothecoides TaxID=3075 RepID=A0A087SU87_AUXPR|nr:hypothetical protein F751_1667 [Auxenochlorella protothecoides]KFM29291.1 hypothetical protein F751_1667 [Auxenochlorella protothecoides]
MPVLDAVLALLILINVVAAGIGVECMRKLAARVTIVRWLWRVLQINWPVPTSTVLGFVDIWDQFVCSRNSFEVRFAVFCDQLGDYLEEVLQRVLDYIEKTFQAAPEDQAWRLRSLGLRRITAWDLQHGVGALQQTTCAICLEDWKHAEQIREVLDRACTGRLPPYTLYRFLHSRVEVGKTIAPGFDPAPVNRLAVHGAGDAMALHCKDGNVLLSSLGSLRSSSLVLSWGAPAVPCTRLDPGAGPFFMPVWAADDLAIPSLASNRVLLYAGAEGRHSLPHTALALVRQGRNAAVSCLHVPPPGTAPFRLAAGTLDGHVGLWDSRDPGRGQGGALAPDLVLEMVSGRYAPGRHSVAGLSVRDGGNAVVAAYSTGTVRTWDLRGGRTAAACFGARIHSHPELSQVSLPGMLADIPGLEDWPDPEHPDRLAFHLLGKWCGVLDVAAGRITHLYAPEYTPDEEARRPILTGPPEPGAWLPDGEYAVSDQGGDVFLLGFGTRGGGHQATFSGMFASRAPHFQAELSTRCYALEYIPTSDELLVSGGDYLELLGRGVGAVQWQDA